MNCGVGSNDLEKKRSSDIVWYQRVLVERRSWKDGEAEWKIYRAVSSTDLH